MKISKIYKHKNIQKFFKIEKKWVCNALQKTHYFFVKISRVLNRTAEVVPPKEKTRAISNVSAVCAHPCRRRTSPAGWSSSTCPALSQERGANAIPNIINMELTIHLQHWWASLNRTCIIRKSIIVNVYGKSNFSKSSNNTNQLSVFPLQ